MYNNEFICPDKHTFSANAKIRARCPECGKMARRTYVPKEVPTTVVAEGIEPTTQPETTQSEPPTNGLQLIRRGRPKGIMVAKKTTPAKDANGRFVSSKKTTSDKPKKPVIKTSNQLVSRKTVSAGTKKKPTMPKVVKRPPRTAIARHIAGGKVSYADQMIGSYGIRR